MHQVHLLEPGTSIPDGGFLIGNPRPCRASGRNLQNLARLDLVRVRQLIAVRLEDFRVGACASEMLFGNRTESVACFYRVGPSAAAAGRTHRSATGDLDVSDNVIFPGGDRLDGIPELILLILCLHCCVEMQLAVALYSAAVELSLCR